MPHKHRHERWWDRTAPQPDIEFDVVPGGGEALPSDWVGHQAASGGVEFLWSYYQPPPSSTPKEQHP